jgi:NADPH:quinone reductase-like Zn-dependent oxidoreductase
MKAIIQHRYGPPDILNLENVEKPVPKDDEVLLRAHAVSLNPIDGKMIRCKPIVGRIVLGLRKPKRATPGRDFAGLVESVGSRVTRFKAGDVVFGQAKGALAEYACADERTLARKPENVSFEQAAGVLVAGLTAIQGLRDKGKLRPGQKVLINGAAGGVGTFAVQIAKALGADVTGVCSTRNVDLVRSIGANHVIDYTAEDFTEVGRRYDLLLDLIGNHSFAERRRILTRKGICILAGAGGAGEHGESWPRMIGQIVAALRSPFVSQKFVMLMARVNQADLEYLSELMAAGKVTPVVDRVFLLNEVAEAFRYLEQGHARGKVVITV